MDNRFCSAAHTMNECGYLDHPNCRCLGHDLPKCTMSQIEDIPFDISNLQARRRLNDVDIVSHALVHADSLGVSLCLQVEEPVGMEATYSLISPNSILLISSALEGAISLTLLRIFSSLT